MPAPFTFPQPPLYPGEPVFGSLLEMRRDAIGLLRNAHGEHGDVVRLKFLGIESITSFLRPEHIKRIMLDNYKNYGKSSRGYIALRRVFGNGLLVSEGSFWRRQRRIAQPSFHHHRIAGFASTMTTACNSMLDDWDVTFGAGETFDLGEQMMKVTLRIAAQTLLSVDVDDHDARVVAPALTTLLENTMEEALKVVQLPSWLPTSRNRRFNQALSDLDAIVYGIIRGRRADPSGAHDLLAMLMEAKDEETGEQMSDKQLRDEVMTMFLAGHETTGNALTWTFYYLNEHPDVAARLLEELDAVLGGRTPTLEDAMKLAYTERVIKESMRLRPPVWLFARSVNEDDEIGGYRVPAKSKVFVSPYFTHRHPDLWDEPERFDPDRFLPEAEAARDKYAYIPFAGGPRICIGNAFAMLEAKLLLAQIAQRFDVVRATDAPVKMRPVIVLRPRDGLPVRLRRR